MTRWRYGDGDPILSAQTILVIISLTVAALVERFVFGGHPSYSYLGLFGLYLIFDAIESVGRKLLIVEGKLDAVIEKLKDP